MHAQTRDDASWLKVVLYTVAVPLTGGRSDSLYRGTTAAHYVPMVESVTGELWLWVVTSRRTTRPKNSLPSLLPSVLRNYPPNRHGTDRFGLLNFKPRGKLQICARGSATQLQKKPKQNPPKS